MRGPGARGEGVGTGSSPSSLQTLTTNPEALAHDLQVTPVMCYTPLLCHTRVRTGVPPPHRCPHGQVRRNPGSPESQTREVDAPHLPQGAQPLPRVRAGSEAGKVDNPRQLGGGWGGGSPASKRREGAVAVTGGPGRVPRSKSSSSIVWLCGLGHIPPCLSFPTCGVATMTFSVGVSARRDS